MDIHEFLENLKTTKGTLSVDGGIVHFENGTSFDLNEAPQPAYLLVQEGGSSAELYLHGWDSRDEAERDRRDCAGGAYRTTPIIEVSADLARHPAFFDAVNSILAAIPDLEYPEARVEEVQPPLINRLKESYPGKLFETNANGTIFLIDNDMAIFNPLLSSCCRFTSVDRYGLTVEDAEAMSKHNEGHHE